MSFVLVSFFFSPFLAPFSDAESDNFSLGNLSELAGLTPRSNNLSKNKKQRKEIDLVSDYQQKREADVIEIVSPNSHAPSTIKKKRERVLIDLDEEFDPMSLLDSTSMTRVMSDMTPLRRYGEEMPNDNNVVIPKKAASDLGSLRREVEENEFEDDDEKKEKNETKKKKKKKMVEKVVKEKKKSKKERMREAFENMRFHCHESVVVTKFKNGIQAAEKFSNLSIVTDNDICDMCVLFKMGEDFENHVIRVINGEEFWDMIKDPLPPAPMDSTFLILWMKSILEHRLLRER